MAITAGDPRYNDGSTDQFTGTATTTPANVPAVAGNTILSVLVRCASDQVVSRRLQVSFDGGTTYLTLSPGEFVGWPLADGITQIQVKTPSSVADYEIIMNRN